jgi:hypothetical protein
LHTAGVREAAGTGAVTSVAIAVEMAAAIDENLRFILFLLD